MVQRPSRLVILTTLAILFIITVSFFREAPLSPEERAPGHIWKSLPNLDISDEMLSGNSVMPKLENETAKAELGQASWRVLHTMMARYPEEPSAEEQETLRSFVYLFGRLYPCGDCATHFLKLLKKFPPQVSSRNAAAGWACLVHNEVNIRLKKEIFDCNNIGDFYDCGCGADDDDTKDEPQINDDDGNIPGEPGQKPDIDEEATNKGTSDAITPVEINDEPVTNG